MTIGMDQRLPRKGNNCMMKIEQAVCNIETEMKAVPTITAKTWVEVTATRTVTTSKANECAQKRQ